MMMAAPPNGIPSHIHMMMPDKVSGPEIAEDGMEQGSGGTMPNNGIPAGANKRFVRNSGMQQNANNNNNSNGWFRRNMENNNNSKLDMGGQAPAQMQQMPTDGETSMQRAEGMHDATPNGGSRMMNMTGGLDHNDGPRGGTFGGLKPSRSLADVFSMGERRRTAGGPQQQQLLMQQQQQHQQQQALRKGMFRSSKSTTSLRGTHGGVDPFSMPGYRASTPDGGAMTEGTFPNQTFPMGYPSSHEAALAAAVGVVNGPGGMRHIPPHGFLPAHPYVPFHPGMMGPGYPNNNGMFSASLGKGVGNKSSGGAPTNSYFPGESQRMMMEKEGFDRRLEKDRQLQEHLKERDRMLQVRLEVEQRNKRMLEERVMRMQQQLLEVQAEQQRQSNKQRSSNLAYNKFHHIEEDLIENMSQLEKLGGRTDEEEYDRHITGRSSSKQQQQQHGGSSGNRRSSARHNPSPYRTDATNPSRGSTQARRPSSIPNLDDSSSDQNIPYAVEVSAPRSRGEAKESMNRRHRSKSRPKSRSRGRPESSGGGSISSSQQQQLQRRGQGMVRRPSSDRLSAAPSKRKSITTSTSQKSVMSGGSSNASKLTENEEEMALFQFRRKEKDGKLIAETTLHSKPDEIMSDLVKRLQQEDNGSSGLLTFPKKDAIALKKGERRIVFSLKHVKGARFSKEEFGRMQANEILWLTKMRPLVIDIQTERCGNASARSGEKVDVF